MTSDRRHLTWFFALLDASIDVGQIYLKGTMKVAMIEPAQHNGVLLMQLPDEMIAVGDGLETRLEDADGFIAVLVDVTLISVTGDALERV